MAEGISGRIAGNRTLSGTGYREPQGFALRTARSSGNLAIISGSSRAGDIETPLNLGVHGARHLHVILVDE
jgi:hypothetical protein